MRRADSLHRMHVQEHAWGVLPRPSRELEVRDYHPLYYVQVQVSSVSPR
jgi:hypothetical protein